jgi:hypothetical protein
VNFNQLTGSIPPEWGISPWKGCLWSTNQWQHPMLSLSYLDLFIFPKQICEPTTPEFQAGSNCNNGMADLF